MFVVEDVGFRPRSAKYKMLRIGMLRFSFCTRGPKMPYATCAFNDSY